MFFKRRKLSEIEFTDKAIQELKKVIPDLEIISREGLEVVISHSKSDESRIFLNNCYTAYLGDVKNLKEILSRYILGYLEIYQPKVAIKRGRIVPVIKDINFINSIEELNAGISTKHVYEKYNTELFIFYVEDKDNSVHYLLEEDLAELNLNLEDIRELSIENLQNLTTIKRNGNINLFMLTSGGNYEASSILLDIWNKETFPVKGNIVIGIPARDMLMITGSEDSEGLHKMYDIIEEINSEGNYLISNKMFEWNGNIFEVFKL